MKKKEKKHLSTNHVLLGLLMFVLVFVVAADIFFLLSEKKEDVLGAAVNLNAETVSTVGPAYDWTTGEVLFDFKDQETAPAEGEWYYLDTTQRVGDGAALVSGLWITEGSPRIGSRNMSLGDTGDDVKAIQVALNKLNVGRDEDSSYPVLDSSGKFDDKTETAVKVMQSYYNVEDNGIVDSSFIKNLLNDITSVEG